MFNLKAQKLLLLTIAAVLVLAGCGNNGKSGNAENNGNNGAGGNNAAAEIEIPAALADKGDIKIKVIRKIGGDDNTAQFLAGAKQEGTSMGFDVDTFSANGDTTKFLDALDQAANSDVDAVVVSHGDDEATVAAVQKLRDKGIEVVAFDSNDGLANIDGVTLTSQDDEALAQLTLDQLVKEQGEDAKILYLWVDGFPPMVRRNKVYQETLAKYPNIEELDRFGVANDNTSVDTQNAVAALLAKYPKGEIDAIFATWDAFAQGAARALQEAGRTEIKIYGIDVANNDLQMMQEENSPWVSTAAVDAKMIGAVNVRIAVNKLAGIETPATYGLEAALITQEDLKASSDPVNITTLENIVPGWGKTDAFETDWMDALKEKNKK
ncbi:sugar ABC transporter substrate-binding protein [Paenibacillus sp. HB172176]|uniref:sugar ABC transporter substrate-binding protein n=1 Tax=Paenibacillus sp. HB172176 TaxID=2493690 RepID=UPI00143A072B|nr:sugar ABC transporter substrate-binding protein [Paenibacillus sp. HB172176]